MIERPRSEIIGWCEGAGIFFSGGGWLVGCFGFNGPLRQYFSLYRAVSQREGEGGERIDESKNVQTTRGWSGGAMVLGKLPVGWLVVLGLTTL